MTDLPEKKSEEPRPGTALEALRDVVFLEGKQLELTAPSRAIQMKRVLKALDVAAEVIFGYWRERMGKTNRVILDDKRRSKIIQRLRENGGDVSELLFTVDGALRDQYLMGTSNNGGRRYDGIETIFRDRGQVERLVELSRWDGDTEHPYLAGTKGG